MAQEKSDSDQSGCAALVGVLMIIFGPWLIIKGIVEPVATRFDTIEKRLGAIEKRLDDLESKGSQEK